MSPCQTPGANYSIAIAPRCVAVAVSLPMSLTLTAGEAAAMDARLHDAVEAVLGPYFPEGSSDG